MPKKFLVLVTRNVLRSRTRLVATMLGCAIAAFVVAFFSAADRSLEQVTRLAKKNANLIVTQKDRFCPTASLIPDSDAERIKNLPQVEAVMPVRLLMTNCQSATDMIAIHGVDKQTFEIFREYEVAPAALAAFRADVGGALVGERIAARYGWKVGQNVTLQELRGISFNVAGLFSTGGTVEDFNILVGRRFLQEAVDAQGISHYVLVKIAPDADPHALSRAIDRLPFTVTTVTRPEAAALATAIAQLEDLLKVSRVVIVVIVAVVLAALGNAIAMATRERSAEFGILRTLGFGKSTILLMVVAEGAVQALAGAITGCAVVHALLSFGVVGTVSSCKFSFEISAGPAVFAVGIIAIVTAGVLGCLAPAWKASRLNIVSAIRHEE